MLFWNSPWINILKLWLCASRPSSLNFCFVAWTSHLANDNVRNGQTIACASSMHDTLSFADNKLASTGSLTDWYLICSFWVVQEFKYFFQSEVFSIRIAKCWSYDFKGIWRYLVLCAQPRYIKIFSHTEFNFSFIHITTSRAF